jgi:hypothetical protein
MNSDERVRDALVGSVARATAPADLLDRSLAQAVKRRRRQIVFGTCVATVAIAVTAAVGTAAVVDHNGRSSTGPTTDTPTTAAPTGPVEDLTGQELADALGLIRMPSCHSVVAGVADGATFCMDGPYSPVEVEEFIYQLRGYERTQTVVDLAEVTVQLRQMGGGGGPETADEIDQLRDLMQRRSELFDQLYAEQGQHPPTDYRPAPTSVQNPTY